ncbi:DNA methyltransferase [Corallococcus sp. AS-1-12]|uniref:DNA methyltransferase n=1 Tax=Corallococcus sp. AS-1-12 TaxID=2874598 RepID=UPI00351D3182
MKNELLAERAALFLGDAAHVAQVLAPDSIDSIVTDPPAGIGFMGREWDSDRGGREQWIGWLAGVMREALYVLKPGGHALVWALPRTSHWTATALEDAGFEVRDIIMHLFGTGFPKSLDVAQAIDKQRDDRQAILAVTRWIAEARDRAGLTNAQIDAVFGLNGMAGHWTTQGAQPYVPHEDYWPTLLELLGVNEVPEEIRSLAERLISDKGKPGPDWFRRPVTGTHTAAAAGTRWRANNGFKSNPTPSSRRDVPATDAARKWQGWGTALKPAAEHWILARKPLAGTVAKNVLHHGTGALNIDGCRTLERPSSSRTTDGGLGRWPSNVTLDEDAAALLPGSASRVCYVAKPSRAERDAGCQHLPRRTGAEACGRTEDSAGLKSPRAGANSGGGHNFHPTVKSIALMRWLCRLVTPPGGVVLDLFAGSGSTGIAALADGFEFIGIEREPEYLALARARIEHALEQARREVTP